MPNWVDKLNYLISRPPTILKVGHPMLRMKSKPVSRDDLKSEAFKKMISQMEKVFHSPYYPVLGIAANQCG